MVFSTPCKSPGAPTNESPCSRRCREVATPSACTTDLLQEEQLPWEVVWALGGSCVLWSEGHLKYVQVKPIHAVYKLRMRFWVCTLHTLPFAVPSFLPSFIHVLFIHSLKAPLMECLPYAKSWAGSRGHSNANGILATLEELMT